MQAVLWRVRALQPMHRLDSHRGVVMAVELDDSAITAFTGAGDGLVTVWDVSSGHSITTVGLKGLPVTSLSWSKGWLAAGFGSCITVWQTETWQAIAELKGHEDRVESVQLKRWGTTDRGLVLSASRDNTVRYWEIKMGVCVCTLSVHHDTVNAVTSDTVCIASASDDHTLRLWNFQTPIPPHHES